MIGGTLMKRRTILELLAIIAIVTTGAWAAAHILKMKRPTAVDEAHHDHHTGGDAHGEEDHAGHSDEHSKHEPAQVRLTPEQRRNAALVIEETQPAQIRTMLPLYGRIEENQDAMAHVVPRFPGVLKEVRKRLGGKVAKGDVLALVEANESLRIYEIKSEIDGTIIEKDATRGEFVRDDKEIFTIADVSTVWVHQSVFRQDFQLLKESQPVTVHYGDARIATKIDYISPFGAQTTQTMLARCVISNPRGDLRPGLFVTADVQIGEVDAPVTVRSGALQLLEEKPVIFVVDKDVFAAREVDPGADDGDRLEIKSGLRAGEKYVAVNAFILKAEIGKGEAEHHH
jgi:cobalt-zinc-cadmium efflux system membrane fusion protein